MNNKQFNDLIDLMIAIKKQYPYFDCGTCATLAAALIKDKAVFI